MVTAVDVVVACYGDVEFGCDDGVVACYDDGVVVVMVTVLSAVMVE